MIVLLTYVFKKNEEKKENMIATNPATCTYKSKIRDMRGRCLGEPTLRPSPPLSQLGIAVVGGGCAGGAAQKGV